jgi:hypothetical protein
MTNTFLSFPRKLAYRHAGGNPNLFKIPHINYVRDKKHPGMLPSRGGVIPVRVSGPGVLIGRDSPRDLRAPLSHMRAAILLFLGDVSRDRGRSGGLTGRLSSSLGGANFGVVLRR